MNPLCTSLHPLYTEEDVVFEPGLIGEWSEDDDEWTWAFSKEGTYEYTLVVTNDGGNSDATLSAHLLRIKGQLFLDFFPEEPYLTEDSFHQFHLFPVHSFLHVKKVEPRLQMSFPDLEWLGELLEENPKAIQHEMTDNGFILTASTKDLQAFWLKHLETEGAFHELSNMKRNTTTVPEESPAQPDVDVGN